MKRDVYEFVEAGAKSDIPDLYVANKLYTPSYVSLETALFIYGLIPDVAAQVTSLTTRATREFRNRHGAFFYRSCRKRVFAGYRLMQYEGTKILIADEEKALVDFIYFALRQRSPLDFGEERFEKNKLKGLNWRKALNVK